MNFLVYWRPLLEELHWTRGTAVEWTPVPPPRTHLPLVPAPLPAPPPVYPDCCCSSPPEEMEGSSGHTSRSAPQPPKAVMLLRDDDEILVSLRSFDWSFKEKNP